MKSVKKNKVAVFRVGIVIALTVISFEINSLKNLKKKCAYEVLSTLSRFDNRK